MLMGVMVGGHRLAEEEVVVEGGHHPVLRAAREMMIPRRLWIGILLIILMPVGITARSLRRMRGGSSAGRGLWALR